MQFGDGSDGDVVISTDTTLTSDMNYTNLTVDVGATLYPDGYIIYVKDSLILNGSISCSGNAGTGGAMGELNQGAPGIGGEGLSTRSLGGSGGGGDGGYGLTYDNGEAGDSISDGIACSAGGAGGDATWTGIAGGKPGGSGGTTDTCHSVHVIEDLPDIYNFAAARMGGAGGGGAGGDDFRCGGGSIPPYLKYTGGGGGGGGAGIVYISAKNINGSGDISCIGGAGGHGSSGYCFGNSADSKYGGGGGGGCVVLEYSHSNFYGYVDVSGGSGHNTGSAGKVYYLHIGNVLLQPIYGSESYMMIRSEKINVGDKVRLYPYKGGGKVAIKEKWAIGSKITYKKDDI